MFINLFAPGDFAEKRVLKLVEWFSGHCRASLRTQTAYFRKIRLRSQANIDQHYPKNAFIGVTSFNIFMLQKKRKRNNEIARVLHFNKSTKLLFFYLPKVMRCFKQNERIRCKKYDPVTTRTWNLLIRSIQRILLLFHNQLYFKYAL